MSGRWTEREERIAGVLAAQEGVEMSARLLWKARDLIASGALEDVPSAGDCPWWGDQCLTTKAEHDACTHDPCVKHRLNREKYARWEPQLALASLGTLVAVGGFDPYGVGYYSTTVEPGEDEAAATRRAKAEALARTKPQRQLLRRFRAWLRGGDGR